MEMSDWISVNDRLPEDSVIARCLVYCEHEEYGELITTSFFSTYYHAWTETCKEYSELECGANSIYFSISHESGARVTHWMPLPEPPKEEE